MSKSVGTVVMWLVAAVASAAPLPGFVLTAQTPHVSFFSRGEKVDTQRVEKRVVELQTLFGRPLAQRATYYRYATAQEVAAGTGHYAAGVTFAGTGEVHSTEAFHDHELVHLVAGQLGDPGAFFQEGLAVAVGNGGKWQGRSADRIAKGSTASVTAMVAGFDSFEANEAYAVAGSFVGYLIRTEGMTKVTAFFRACGPKVDASAAFAQSFGRTLETVAGEWQKSL
jgi:hypothetical protein